MSVRILIGAWEEEGVLGLHNEWCIKAISIAGPTVVHKMHNYSNARFTFYHVYCMNNSPAIVWMDTVYTI